MPPEVYLKPNHRIEVQNTHHKVVPTSIHFKLTNDSMDYLLNSSSGYSVFIIKIFVKKNKIEGFILNFKFYTLYNKFMNRHI